MEIPMSVSIRTNMLSFAAALVCAFVTVGISVAPAVNPAPAVSAQAA